jgi:hypothetical protein
MFTNEYLNRLRYLINRYIFDNGFAPTYTQLALLSDSSQNEARQGLQALADSHALVLHPNSFEIWVAHPFALFPTLFWVKTSEKQWWGNCAWCSLGIASLTNTDTEIFTKLEGEQEPLSIYVSKGQVLEKDYVVHFAIPAAKLWDNVIYTCANILIFENENAVDNWCKRHNKPKGAVVPIEQAWTLSKIWYGNYLDSGFTRKTKEIAAEMYAKAGLTGDFWKL